MMTRSRYGTPGGDFLGEEQWDWLERQLLAPPPPGVAATVVVSTLPVLAERFGFGEGWVSAATAHFRRSDRRWVGRM
jgi:hypothetical protein